MWQSVEEAVPPAELHLDGRLQEQFCLLRLHGGDNAAVNWAPRHDKLTDYLELQEEPDSAELKWRQRWGYHASKSRERQAV